MDSLCLDTLIEHLDETFRGLPDHRRGSNTTYEIRDAALAAFSVFMMQSPSFLAHQRDLERRKGFNNVTSLFGAEQIPSDQQIRNLLDPVAPVHLRDPFWWIWEQVRTTPAAATFRGVNESVLCVFDGTYYFSSQKIHCARCSQRQLANGETLYYHSMVTPVLVSPAHNQVLCLDPEFIMPQDGEEKQDCERAAAKRWVERNGERLAAESATILGDDLYANQPFCQLLLEQGLNFILVCKPDSHPTLYQEIELLSKLGALEEVTERHWNGQFTEVRRYRFLNQLPLTAQAAPLLVNWCEVTITHAQTGAQLYYNSFITNFAITADNVAEITAAGRTRWKVENENNNVLKNYGYHLEHNYGHGQQYLSAILVMLNLLAFLVHTVLDLTHPLYQQLRQEVGTRQTFFGDLRTLLRYLPFSSWSHLFAFMRQGLELDPPETALLPLPP